MWTPIPSSRATASASPISPALQGGRRAGAARSTPIIRSKTTIGVARTRGPELDQRPRTPRSASSSSNSSTTSPIATVPPVAGGEVRDRQPIDDSGASGSRRRPTRRRRHRRRRASPRRTKHRAGPSARPTPRPRPAASASRSSSDRTLAIAETSRSRSSASVSATAERPARARARPPPPPSGAAEVVGRKARRSCVVASARTPMTRLSRSAGRNAALLAPTAAATGWWICGRALHVVDHDRRGVEDGARDAGRLVWRSKRMPRQNSKSTPSRRASRPRATFRPRPRARARRTRRRASLAISSSTALPRTPVARVGRARPTTSRALQLALPLGGAPLGLLRALEPRR